MQHLFLINPTAGKTDPTGSVTASARALCEKLGEPCEIRISTQRGDIRRFAREAGEAGVETRLYACGGDGTLNEAVSGAVGYPNLSLTCFPCGSGNDFVKYFSGKALFFRPEAFLRTEERRIDLMDVNGHACVNICSAGFDARIGTDIDAWRRFPLLGGSRAYTASVIVNLLRGVVRPCRVELEDGTVVDEPLTLCCICNGRWYGGSYNPIRDACLTDGVLDVLVVKKVSRLTVAKVIAAYQKGQYADYPSMITRYRSNYLHIHTPKPEPVNIDGELLLTDDFEVRLLPGALRFFAPEGAW